jgi:chromate transporter
MWGIAALAFVAIYFFHVPFPVIIFGAALAGFLGGRFWKERLVNQSVHDGQDTTSASVFKDGVELREHMRPSWRRSLRVMAVCFALWWLPILFLGAWQGWHSTLFQEGVFFSKAAVVTFGGAYAVLPYVAQQALGTYGWLQTGQMMDGLGLAETTPGPLIMVLQFVGFMGGWNQPGALPPLLAATLGAFFTTWATFVPCFLWIFL